MGGKNGNRTPATAGPSVPHHMNRDTAPHTAYSFPVDYTTPGLVPISKVAGMRSQSLTCRVSLFRTRAEYNTNITT